MKLELHPIEVEWVDCPTHLQLLNWMQIVTPFREI